MYDAKKVLDRRIGKLEKRLRFSVISGTETQRSEIFCGPQGGLQSVWHLYFLKDVVKMCFYGVDTDAKFFGDLPVR
jgi:hypothetical protein